MLVRWVVGIVFCLSNVVRAEPSSFVPILAKNLAEPEDKPNYMTEADFNQSIDRVVDFYSPIAAAYGKGFFIYKYWHKSGEGMWFEENTHSWRLFMLGGSARLPGLTPDGFSLGICQVVGKIFGGFPFHNNSNWIASIGQSAYFASHVCARKIWADQHSENAKSRSKVPAFVKAQCDQVYSGSDSQNLCYRTSLASLSFAKVYANLRGQPVPAFDQPDSWIAPETNVEIPSAQCHLDTLFQGALCNVPWDDYDIPGQFDMGSQNSLSAEIRASANSCTLGRETIGLRPRCWFAPRLGTLSL